MKKTLKRTILFVFVFITTNILLGFIAKKVYFSQKTGKYARLTYSIENNVSEIIIMGSSHANRHYIPAIIENELNMSCYNSGVQGQKIIFHNALLKVILKRYKPKVIILNIDPGWMYESSEAYGRLADLYPYYWSNRAELAPIFSIKSNFNDAKLIFSSYQTNSTIVHAIKYSFSPQNDFKGYRPLYNKTEPKKVIPNSESIASFQDRKICPNFVTSFKEFIEQTDEKGADLIFVISPNLVYANSWSKNKSMSLMKSIADSYKIPIVDFTNHKIFLNQFDLFNDPGHLNNDGATLFTQTLADSLKDIIKN